MRGAAREQVETADRPAAEPGIAAQAQAPGHALGARQRERRRVEDHQPLDSLAVGERPAEADHAAPVVHRQRHRASDVEVLQQRLEVIDARLQVEGLRVVGRSLGQPMWSGTMRVAVAQASTRCRQ